MLAHILQALILIGLAQVVLVICMMRWTRRTPLRLRDGKTGRP